jgi:hypothetical protein
MAKLGKRFAVRWDYIGYNMAPSHLFNVMVDGAGKYNDLAVIIPAVAPRK